MKRISVSFETANRHSEGEGEEGVEPSTENRPASFSRKEKVISAASEKTWRGGFQSFCQAKEKGKKFREFFSAKERFGARLEAGHSASQGERNPR